VVFASFFSVLSNSSFIWDDYLNVLPYAQDHAVNIDKIILYWQKPFENLYIPVTYSIWACLWDLTSCFVKNDPQLTIHAQILHVSNLGFHILNSILIFLIILRLIRDKRAALVGAILFGIHPVQVESVAFISEFRSLLACFFSLLSIHQYFLSDSNSPPVPSQSIFSKWIPVHYILSILFFILALLSKPVSVVVPIFLFILNAVFSKKNMAQNMVSLWPWFILVVPIVIITKFVQPDVDLAYIPSIWQRPFVVFDTATFYLGKLIFPNALGIDYGRTPESVLDSIWGYFTGLISFGLLIFLWLLRKKYPEYLACYLIFLAGILPVSGIIPFNFQHASTVADRYLYFSMMGPALAGALFISKENNWKHLTPVFMIIFFLMMTTYMQTRTWDNAIKLYTQALKVNSKSNKALNNLATHIREADPVTAMTLYREAISFNPNNRIALANLALTIYDIKARYPSYSFSKYLPQDTVWHQKEEKYFQEGVRLSKADNYSKAIEQFGKATALNILNPQTYNNLGILMLHYKKEQGKSIHFFRLAAMLAPESVAAWNNLAVATYHFGDRKAAADYFNRALAISGNEPVVISNRDKAIKNKTMGNNAQENLSEFKFMGSSD